MVRGIVSERKHHKERGDPARVIKLNEKQTCVSCSEAIEEGDYASLSHINHGFYCNNKECKPPTTGGTIKGMKKISSNFMIEYKENRSKEEIVEQLKTKYENEGYDMPEQSELEMMAKKRLKNSDKESDEFMSESVPLEKV